MLAQLGGLHIAAPPAGVNKPGVKLDLDRAAERYRALLETGRQIGVIPQLEIWGASANLSRVSEAAFVAAQSAIPTRVCWRTPSTCTKAAASRPRCACWGAV